MIPYGRQDISAEDIAEVTAVLRSDFLTQGPAVPAFEQTVKDYTGVAHALAVNSATSALHIACLALGAGPGSRVWTSPNSFVASANCALYCGAAVDFVDIDPATFNMSVSALEQKLATAKAAGTLPQIVIPVHFAGQSCDMAAIHDLSKQYGFAIIEDASHAIGGRYREEPVGSCRYSDICIFSFHPVKIVTTAEGGMALTHRADLAEKMALLRSHGITRDSARMTEAPEGGWVYEQVDLGFNYRLTDLQAALGTSQMRRIDGFVSRRHELAARYDAAFDKAGIGRQRQTADAYSAYHLYPIQLPAAVVQGQGRAAVFGRLRAAGVGVNVHYIPIHTQPYYRKLGFKPGDFPKAEGYYAAAVSLPMFPRLSDADQDFVIEQVIAACS